ncbi:hypothetical protein [Saccharopolyspora phatthalungensis]|uniref:Uncharacterized protein n=1 Tax=Saccharopolyspora phatthalungensis TaxID=664693 RepID=A0A840PXL8_9PSEU|nr:hypothetical protein [Saccharopolyspora phatthalungensis]MBB5152507.1 hypothetical protein [Saccharopolyspora phatthalungensis]
MTAAESRTAERRLTRLDLLLGLIVVVLVLAAVASVSVGAKALPPAAVLDASFHGRTCNPDDLII